MTARRVLILAGAMLAMAPGCRTEPPPSYVRLEGAAPELQGLPDSSARLVIFWASWCPPCRQETPGLLALAEEPPQGLQIVVFSHDTDMKAVETVLGGVPAPGLHLRLDEDRRAASAFGVDTLPTSLLVVNGRMVARFQGPREWSSQGMRHLLEKLMRERPSQAPAPAH